MSDDERELEKSFADHDRETRKDEQISDEDAANLVLNSAEERRELRSARLALSKSMDEVRQLRKALDLFEALDEAQPEPPEWLAPRTPTRGHHATVNFLLTDTHCDEIVRPEEIDFLNAYSRAIAEIRLKRAFSECVSLSRDYLAGVEYDGIVVFFGGDMFSGNIHDELKETNVSTIADAVVHWIEHFEAGINMLAEAFPKVHVVGVVGNHGRMTKKPIAKRRAMDNVDWMLYKFMARDYKDHPTVTFQIGESADAMVKVYDTQYLLTHGDQFRGGTGISAALAPLMLGAHRKTKRQNAAGHPYDVMVMGHFHNYMSLPSKGLLVGGALKGYDEYAFLGNFEPEPAQAAMWLTTPEHGVGFSLPIIVQDRKAEGW